jgi:hypothetical protein
VTTSELGSFTVPLLPPGTYTIKARGNGFTPIEIPNVTLNVGDQKSLQIQLKAGDVNATVTVDSSAEAIRTDAAVSTVVDRQFIEHIPLNGRSFQSLILLTPGVTTNSPQSLAQVGATGEFSVNGQRTESNRYTVDGISANNGTFVFGYGTAGSSGGLPTGTAMGTTQSLVSLDALQEFRVLSSSYSAEFGRSPGGQFSFVTRSGANAFHGSAFDYFRNDALDANDWFNNSFARAKPAERQNDFGGTLSGPVTIPRLYNGRDRTFFFFSYEGLRLQQPQPATLAYVPSLLMRQQAPSALKGFLNAYPLPNGVDQTGGLSGLSEYIYTDSLPSRVDSTSVRVDHSIGSSLRLFFRYSNTPSQTKLRSLTYYETRQFSPRSYLFGATSLFSAELSNEFRIGFSPNEGGSIDRYLNRDGAQPTDLFQAQGIDLKANPHAFVYLGINFPGSSTTVGVQSVTAPQNQWNVTDSASFTLGKHQLKFGADLLRTASRLQQNDPYIFAYFDSFAAVLANQAAFGGVFRFAESDPVFTNFGAFIQDEWRLTSRLGLSLGLRWEVSPPPSVSRGELPRILSGSVTQPGSLALAPQGTPLWKTTYDNFAPRLGFSYQLRNSASYQTMLRGGSGIFFDTGQNLRIAALDQNPGTSYLSFCPSASCPAPLSFPFTPAQLNISVANSLTPPYSAIFQVGDPVYPHKLPYTLQWNFSVEQTLHAPQSLTVSYVGARGHRLLEQDRLNLSSFNANFPSITLVRNGLTSDYHAFQAQFQRRLSRGLQALASYTWSHSIDYGSQNAQLANRRGDSDFDIRHNFSSAVSYELRIGVKNEIARTLLNHWRIDGRFSARSAFPVTLNGRTLTDPSTGQQYFGGLDLVAGVPLYLYSPNFPGGRRVNPLAFKLPTGSQVGTAPRNFVRGFGARQFDLALSREFSLSERFRLQTRVEAFNVFNHPNFGVINGTFNNPQFGRATKILSTSLGGLNALYQQGGPRSIQLSLRLAF